MIKRILSLLLVFSALCCPYLSSVSYAILNDKGIEVEDNMTEEPIAGTKKDGVFTILCVGVDDASMSTDTIMVGRIDTKNHTMDFISIPRDLLINVPWECRKINSVYAGSKGGEEGVEALKMHIKRLIGFDVDYYAFIDLFCFSWAIEALGGVWYDVPMEMSYADEAQDLYIELKPGYQLLNSYEAMGLVRYRYEYFNGDLDRINLQQDFLKSVMSQLISAKNIPNLPWLIRIAKENMLTNLTGGNMVWLAYQLLKTKEENINFYTMPTYTAKIQNYSYAVCRPWDWLPMVNEYLNPLDEEIGWGNVDIVYDDGEKYAGTQGYLSESWYYDKRKEE
ncbi:MAG: LCP family protein [Eubacteriales bacterium]|nr:LCP family protein [Eubacteriales bacterium]